MRWRPWLVCLAAVALASVVTGAQQRIRVRAEAVRVDVLVTDGKRLVSGLTADDFEVRDNGVLQPVVEIQIEHLPLNVIAALDTSSSVAGERLAHLVDGGRALVDALAEGDRLALMTFSGRARLLSPLTGDRETIRAALRAMEASGTTALHDATFAALALRDVDPARTLMLLFSDGVDSGSWLSAERVIEVAKRTDVVIYPVTILSQIQVGPTGAPPRPKMGSGPIPRPPQVEELERLLDKQPVTIGKPSAFLESLAQETGGRTMTAEGDADLRGTFVKTLAEFRDRYVLSYRPAGVTSTGWHAIEVKLKGKRGKLTARRGYFAQ